MPQLNLLLTNRDLNLLQRSYRETTESFEMGFFSLEVAAPPNARTFLLKIDGQLGDQKSDIFLVLLHLKYFLFCLAQRPSHKSSKHFLLNAWFASCQKLLPVQKKLFFFFLLRKWSVLDKTAQKRKNCNCIFSSYLNIFFCMVFFMQRVSLARKKISVLFCCCNNGLLTK